GNLTSDAFDALVAALKDVIEWAREPRELQNADATWELWDEAYPELTAGQPGLLGAMLGRAEAQGLRLSLIYAMLDRSLIVEPRHLKAALAVWQYCEDSVKYVFGDRLGNPDADAILDALRSSTDGLTRTDIRDIFLRHLSAARIERALTVLRQGNL